MSDTSRHTLLIATYLEPDYIERLRQVSPRLHVIYEPDLVPTARYPGDHYNSITRTPEQETRWRALLAQAEIMFDFDPTHHTDLPDLAPHVRWIQATSAGIGQFVRRVGYDHRMPQTIFTTASGVHAGPLADFCLMAILMFAKGLLPMLANQRRRHWERYAGMDLRGKTLGIIGVGSIGMEVARMGQALGMTVIGTKRTISGIDPGTLHLDTLYAPDQLHDMLQRTHYLVLATPHTDATEQMIGASELAALPEGAILINIGRGALIDEPALIESLRSGHLGGAALDVFAIEPLPHDSPFWDMPNVLVSPHSGSTTEGENERITELFCENLRHYLAGEPLINVLDTQMLY